MPEQANSVSSGLSPLVKTAKPGQAELTTSTERAAGKGSAFSNDLDQARKQQSDKVQAESSQRDNRKPATQASASALKHSMPAAKSGQANSQSVDQADGQVSAEAILSGEARLPNDSMADVTAENVIVGKPIPDDVEESASPLLSVNSQALADEATPDTAPVSNQLASGTAPKTDSEGPALSPVTAQLHEQQSDVPTSAATRTASQTHAPAANINTSSGTASELATPVTTAGRSRPLPVRADATRADDSVVVTSAALSESEGLDVGAGRLTKALPGELSVHKTPAENGAVSTINAAALAKGRLSLSGESGAAAMPASDTLVAGQVDKNPVTQTSAVELTRLASGNGIVTPATLAGRFRQLGDVLGVTGASASQTSSQGQLTQAVLPSLNAEAFERQAVGEKMPALLVSESLSDMDSLMGAADVKQTVQQRIAMTEAILSQMAQEAGDVAVKVPSAENLLQAVSGSTVTAPVVQQSALAAGPSVQAPLNINLTSDDAETALAGNVKWMTNEGVKNAVMTVTPHGMGPISVKIGIDGDQMDVSIIASQHSTRDALESMLPRLREQLAVQGHETVKVDVSDGKNEQSRSGSGQAFAESRNPAGASPQDNQSNSSNDGEKKEYGRSSDLEVGSDGVMAEDLQRVAARVVGEAGSRPVFDAYV